MHASRRREPTRRASCPSGPRRRRRSKGACRTTAASRLGQGRDRPDSRRRSGSARRRWPRRPVHGRRRSRSLPRSQQDTCAGDVRHSSRGASVRPEPTRCSLRPRRRDRAPVPRNSLRLGRLEPVHRVRLLRVHHVRLRASRRVAPAPRGLAVRLRDSGFVRSARAPATSSSSIGLEPRRDLHRQRPVRPRAAHRRRRQDLEHVRLVVLLGLRRVGVASDAWRRPAASTHRSSRSRLGARRRSDSA